MFFFFFRATPCASVAGVNEWLDRTCASLGMTHPTDVQIMTIPQIMEGRNVVGCAKTGSGKTAAFALPILQSLAVDPYGVYALVLTPARELAFQIADQFRIFGVGMGLQDAVVVGGCDMLEQSQQLSRRPHVVIGTPGRLSDLIERDPAIAKVFARTKFLVLDEADRLLESTFEDSLSVIFQHIPQERQLLLFSATLTQSLVELQGLLLHDAYCFQQKDASSTVQKLKEEYIFIPAKVKEAYLYHVLCKYVMAVSEESGEGHSKRKGGTNETSTVRSCIVFVGTCRRCNMIDLLLQELGIPVVSIHGNKPQRARLAALEQFRSRKRDILIATDVASRGLDIPSVDLVINLDLPTLPQDYVHRVGRTARAEREGRSLSLVSQYEVQLVQAIEKLTGKQMQGCEEIIEKEVLARLGTVYAAKRTAYLRLADY